MKTEKVKLEPEKIKKCLSCGRWMEYDDWFDDICVECYGPTGPQEVVYK